MSAKRCGAGVFAAAALWLGVCAVAFSQTDSKENADVVSKQASGKFGRGIVNITTGWGELIRCPAEITRQRGLLLGATWGPLKGTAMTVIRTVSGVFEAGLFFYPLPGNYDPFLIPEYVWPGTVFAKERPAGTCGEDSR